MCTAREPRVHCVRADRFRRLLATQQDRRPRAGPPRRAARSKAPPWQRHSSPAWPPGAGSPGPWLRHALRRSGLMGGCSAAVRPCGCKAEVADSAASNHSSRRSSRRTCATSTRQPPCCAPSTRACRRRRHPTPALTLTFARALALFLSLAPSPSFSSSPSPSVRSPVCFSHPRPPPLAPGDPQPARLRCAAAPP